MYFLAGTMFFFAFITIYMYFVSGKYDMIVLVRNAMEA